MIDWKFPLGSVVTFISSLGLTDTVYGIIRYRVAADDDTEDFQEAFDVDEPMYAVLVSVNGDWVGENYYGEQYLVRVTDEEIIKSTKRSAYIDSTRRRVEAYNFRSIAMNP